MQGKGKEDAHDESMWASMKYTAVLLSKMMLGSIAATAALVVPAAITAYLASFFLPRETVAALGFFVAVSILCGGVLLMHRRYIVNQRAVRNSDGD